jgi:hypothetical protein
MSRKEEVFAIIEGLWTVESASELTERLYQLERMITELRGDFELLMSVHQRLFVCAAEHPAPQTRLFAFLFEILRGLFQDTIWGKTNRLANMSRYNAIIKHPLDKPYTADSLLADINAWKHE